MSKFKDKSRRIARERYWEENDRSEYTCPDCGRKESEISEWFEVHHKNGEPMDNRPENHVALCPACHNLREDKKPSIEQIRRLRDEVSEDKTTEQNNSAQEVLEHYLELYEGHAEDHWRKFERKNPDVDEDGNDKNRGGKLTLSNMGVGELVGFHYGYYQATECLTDGLREDVLPKVSTQAETERRAEENKKPSDNSLNWYSKMLQENEIDMVEVAEEIGVDRARAEEWISEWREGRSK